MEVTDTINDDDEIFTAISARKNAAREKDRARVKAKDKPRVRKVGLLSSLSSLLAPAIFFHDSQKVRPN